MCFRLFHLLRVQPATLTISVHIYRQFLNAVVAISATENVTSVIKAFIDDLILTAQKFERLF